MCSLMTVYANFSSKLSVANRQVDSDCAESVSDDGPVALGFTTTEREIEKEKERKFPT